MQNSYNNYITSNSTHVTKYIYTVRDDDKIALHDVQFSFHDPGISLGTGDPHK